MNAFPKLEHNHNWSVKQIKNLVPRRCFSCYVGGGNDELGLKIIRGGGKGCIETGERLVSKMAALTLINKARSELLHPPLFWGGDNPCRSRASNVI